MNTAHRILDPVTITINNCYDVARWEKAVIEQCVIDNPTATCGELATLLGLSDRGLRRKIVSLGIQVKWKCQSSDVKPKIQN